MAYQNSILLLDSAFEQHETKNCSLLIKIGPDCFSYAIINTVTHSVMAVYDEQECGNGLERFNEHVKSDSYLNFEYRETKISFFTENNIAVPTEIYKKNITAAYTSFFGQQATANLQHTEHTEFGFTTVFSLPEIAESLLNGHFVHSQKYEDGAALLMLAGQMKPNSILLDFTANRVNILYLIDSKVIFRQSYETMNAEELNYYLLLMINQLKINTTATFVYLSGIIDENTPKYDCITAVFSHVQFLSIAEDELNQQVLDDLPAHYYTTLLALGRCG